MYCKGSEEHGNSCDFCASITEDDSHIIRAIHALPPEKHPLFARLHGEQALLNGDPVQAEAVLEKAWKRWKNMKI